MKPEDRSTSTETKKPYKAPKLVHLGSVRELTAGTGGSIFDTKSSTKKKAM